MTGRIVGIGVTGRGGAPMEARQEARLIAGAGIEGDRYAEGRGTWSSRPAEKRQLTLISAEDLDDAAIAHLASRRNLAVSGLRLAGSIGARLRIGGAEIEVLSPCPPCAHLERLTAPGVKAALADRGGVYARILVGGVVRLGDEIVVQRPPRRLPS